MRRGDILQVIVYSSSGCSVCAKIKRDLDSWGVPFEERNVTENEAFFDELHERGIYSVPTVRIDGDTFVGYRPKALKQALVEHGLGDMG